jgi:polysaccharide pyruvyl transferase WcaK-like protein
VTHDVGGPPRVAFITPSGWGNLGDAAIVDSLIHAIRVRAPDAAIEGYTLHHLDTALRHHVEAHPLTSFSLPYFPVLPASVDRGYVPPRYDGTDWSPSVSAAGPVARIRSMLRRHMLTVRAIGILEGTMRARREPAALRRLKRDLVGTDAVVVAGGGQLDALFGGVWGQPYVLWRWGRLARSVGARFLVLSVGTGTLDALERRVTVAALRGADRRSYRDEASRSMLRAPDLTAGDLVVPDLAYALPVSVRPLPSRMRMSVGVSPMNYQHPDFYPAADPRRYEQHVSGMYAVCRHLLDRGHEVVLFTTDASDDVALAEIARRLAATHAQAPGRWRIAGARTVDELMAMYGDLDAVVAARLHAALLAHVAHRPVLALAHERKVRALMSDLGHQRFCFDLGAIDEDLLVRRLDELIERRLELADEVADAVNRNRALVEHQYDDVFGPRRSGC